MPDTKEESLREVAEEIAQRFRKQLGFRLNDIVDLSDAIEAALKDRDERAARIAETEAGARCMQHERDKKGVCGYEIAAAIRNEDTNAD